MNISLTQEEIGQIAAQLGESPLRDRLASLARESSTLRAVHEIGLAEGSANQFADWSDKDTPIYPSEADARQAVPRCFKEVCTEWGRAGYIRQKFTLRDGRIVIRRGYWSDTSSSGGATCYYFGE